MSEGLDQAACAKHAVGKGLVGRDHVAMMAAELKARCQCKLISSAGPPQHTSKSANQSLNAGGKLVRYP